MAPLSKDKHVPAGTQQIWYLQLTFLQRPALMEYLDPIVEPQDPDVDIVFVHGLNPKGFQAHARRTWTDEKGVFWPRDLLHQELPSARILLFSYNSSILSNASNANVDSHARTLCDRLKNRRLNEGEIHRPLLFVAHSLGGLLVKQALVEARANPIYKCLKASTKALVFFATPHRGGEGAGVAEAAANVCSAFTGQPKNNLLESLKNKSLITELSSDQFRHQLNDYDVLSLIERRKTPIKTARFVPAKYMFIVDETSAKLGCHQENHQNVDRNHFDICKFSSLDDHAYEGVGPNLKSMTDRARQQRIESDRELPSKIPYTSSVPGSLPSHLAFRGRDHRVTLPKRCNPFLGRDGLVEDIQREWEKPTPKRVSLSGLGGVGKTELSISVVEKLGPMRYVLWLRASDDELLQQDLAKAAQDLRNELLRFHYGSNRAVGEDRSAAAFYFSGVPVTDLVSILKRWLRVTPDDGSRILVVLDDLDGLELSHHDDHSLTFSGDAVDLIYTTRDPLMADDGMLWPAVKFDVPSLEVDKAVDVLDYLSKDSSAARSLSIRSSIQHTSGLEHDSVRAVQMRDIATRLGGLPAAIIIGSHYIKDSLGSKWNPDSYKRFLDSWDHDGRKSNILKSRRAMLKYHHSMLASFELSLCRLRRNAKRTEWYCELEEHCLVLLQLLSAIDLDEIPRNDLSELKNALNIAWHDLLGKIGTVEVDECVTELVKVSLLTERSTDGALLLNNVTKACALLVLTNISSDELVALEGSTKEVWKHWNRGSSKPVNGDAGTSFAEGNGAVSHIDDEKTQTSLGLML